MSSFSVKILTSLPPALIEVLIEAWGISSTIWKSQTDGTAVSGPW